VDGQMIKNTRTGIDGQALPRRVREEIDTMSGSFVVDIDQQVDLYIEICVQSYSATVDVPSRISIKVTEHTKTKEEIALEERKRKLVEKFDEHENIVTTHTSRISAELMRMKRRTDVIVNEIDFSKELEAQFHSKSIELQKAVQYYPMARILIIVMASVIQVTYVVQFMKSKHLY
jgi:emp24/gp25L/p24 family/GOLD